MFYNQMEEQSYHQENQLILQNKKKLILQEKVRVSVLMSILLIIVLYIECERRFNYFQLFQVYELNKLKIWFWDNDSRFYTINTYIIEEKQETLAYDGTAQSSFILKFPDQFVRGFRIQGLIFIFLKIQYQRYQMWMVLIQIKELKIS
ncbi:unnamed protein product [Paramecium octaurelia]|uniref:Transmembrane protein n=1 Tax=Paramecium octaurelia TaxID=43137 RepID=A0A8S1YKI8_PAROT|nr:unnamed protein product [Paramecium octaurelia]